MLPYSHSFPCLFPSDRTALPLSISLSFHHISSSLIFFHLSSNISTSLFPSLPSLPSLTPFKVCNLMWSKNVNEIVSTHGYSLNQVIVWKYPTMQKIATLTGHTLRYREGLHWTVTAIAFICFIVLICIVLYCIVLYCIVLYCIVLHTYTHRQIHTH